eukprot:jgi/Undpi1/8823/HiC_scaffold_25.g11285.m1
MCVGRRRKQEVGAPFQAELDAEDAKDKESLSQHLQLVDKVHGIVVDKIKEQQAKTSIAVEEVREQGKAEVLDAQAVWAQGEDVRREKWMAKRTREIRELTLKGLEPEIERIMDKHKADMEDTERNHHREAQRLRKQVSLRADEALSEERARVRCRVEQGRRELMEACAEIGPALAEGVNNDTIINTANAADISPPRHTDVTISHAHRAEETSYDRKAPSRPGADSEEGIRRGRGAAQAIRLEKEMLTKDRDKKIDAAIRRLQRERLEFEETSKAEAEEESHRLEQSHVKDKRLLREKQEQWEARHAECMDVLQSLVESRRAAALKSRELTAQEGLLTLRVQKMEATYKEEASAARDEETRVLKEHQEMMSETRLRRQELQQKVQSSDAELLEIRTRSESDMSRLRGEHDERLEALHLEVKQKDGLVRDMPPR